jgi:hypothetical protein
MDARTASGCTSDLPRRLLPQRQRKSPSPFGPGLCGVGGRGEGMPITAGGYGQNVGPGVWFPKKIAMGEGDGFQINETPRMRAEAFRRQLPSQATISRPRLLLTPKRRFGKASLRSMPSPRQAGIADSAAFPINHNTLWTRASTRANLCPGQNKVGVSRALAPLSIWGKLSRSLREVLPGRRVRAVSVQFTSEMLVPDCSCHRKSGRNMK